MMEESIVDRSWIARTPSPTRRDVVAVLFRRRRTFLVCFIAIFLAALLYAVLLPSYESQMKILVRRGRVDPPMMPQPTGSSEYSRFDVTEDGIADNPFIAAYCTFEQSKGIQSFPAALLEGVAFALRSDYGPDCCDGLVVASALCI